MFEVRRGFWQPRRPAALVTSPAGTPEVRLVELGHRELDLLSKLSVLYERHELFPGEGTDRQLAEVNRLLDEVRAEIDTLRAEAPDDANVDT